MANQGLLFSKPSIVETEVTCSPTESIKHGECEIFIGALSQEEFDRMKQNFAEC